MPQLDCYFFFSMFATFQLFFVGLLFFFPLGLLGMMLLCFIRGFSDMYIESSLRDRRIRCSYSGVGHLKKTNRMYVRKTAIRYYNTDDANKPKKSYYDNMPKKDNTKTIGDGLVDLFFMLIGLSILIFVLGYNGFSFNSFHNGWEYAKWYFEPEPEAVNNVVPPSVDNNKKIEIDNNLKDNYKEGEKPVPTLLGVGYTAIIVFGIVLGIVYGK